MGGSTVQEAFGVAVQPDDKIVVVGPGRVSGSPSNTDFVVARYNTNGSLDSSFGASGRRATDFGTSFDSAKAVALQPDGKIVVAGGSGVGMTPAQENFAIARYTTAGSLDTSFSGDGMDTVDLGGGSAVGDEAAQERATDVAILPNGEILVAGQSPANVRSRRPQLPPETVQLDREPRRVVQLVAAELRRPGGIAAQVDGKKVVTAGTSDPPDPEDRAFTLVRNFTTGSMLPDTSFGRDNGAPVFTNTFSTCPGTAGAEDVTLAADGGIIVVGAGASCDSQLVARYNGGSPDLTVTPDLEVASGSTITIAGSGLPPSTTVQIKQCHGTSPTQPDCTTLDAAAPVDASGAINEIETVQYVTGGFDCDDPTCRIRVVSPSNAFMPVEEPISLRKQTSTSVTLSAGSVAEGESIVVGGQVTFTAEVKGLVAGGGSHGHCQLYFCGPSGISFPATCTSEAVGGGVSLTLPAAAAAQRPRRPRTTPRGAIACALSTTATRPTSPRPTRARPPACRCGRPRPAARSRSTTPTSPTQGAAATSRSPSPAPTACWPTTSRRGQRTRGQPAQDMPRLARRTNSSLAPTAPRALLTHSAPATAQSQ